MSKEFVRILAAAAFSFGLEAAWAQVAANLDCHQRRHSEKQGTWENDVLVPFDPTDAEYTNGLKVSWTYVSGCAPWWMGTWGQRNLPSVGGKLKRFLYGDSPRAEYSYAMELGHSIFTPNDISISAPIFEDRPYAGYLYGGLSFAVSDAEGPASARRQHQFQALLGSVGPFAHAAQIQKAVHFSTHSAPPRGWDHQLRNEPGLQLNYTFQQRFVFGDRHFDLIPGTSVAIGSLYDYLGMQALLRLGTKNMRAFPISNIGLSAADAGQRSDDRFELYVYGGAEGRAVLHNVFLDGTTFSRSQRVDKKTYVYDLKTGASIRYNSMRLSYSFVRRSREFYPDPPKVNSAGHGFGSVTLSWEPKF